MWSKAATPLQVRNRAEDFQIAKILATQIFSNGNCTQFGFWRRRRLKKAYIHDLNRIYYKLN